MKKNSLSNDNGRALEYTIVNSVLNKYPNSIVDFETQSDQKRDLTKYNDLNDELKKEYNDASIKILNWLDKKLCLSVDSILKIKRFSDDKAKKGDVTDIQIIGNEESVNLSIKHNHNALKHQRPGALPKQCGFDPKSEETKMYKDSYKDINKNFYCLLEAKYPDLESFKDLKSHDKNFINQNLYSPHCENVVDFLNRIINVKHADYFFKFIVGNTNYFKIIVSRDSIVVKEFFNIDKARSLVAKLIDDSHIEVKFSNSWIINMRLHTASSRIGNNPSLKFDTQPVKIKVPEILL